MYYLPQSISLLGKLSIDSVYHHYDVPRAFTVSSKNPKLRKFLAFWIDETETDDTWYYVAVNEKEIENIENGKVQIREIFLYKTLYKVVTPFNTDIEATITEVLQTEVDDKALPPEGFGVCRNDDNTFHIEHKNPESFLLKNNVHKLRLSRNKSKKAIDWLAINEIFGAWQGVYESIVEALKLEDPLLIPGGSTIGSYKMEFSANHNAELMSTFTQIGALLKNKVTKISAFENVNIDLNSLEGLMAALSEHKLTLELFSSSGGVLTTIDSKQIQGSVESINDFNQRKVSSLLVPQANDLGRVILFIKNLAQGEHFDSSSEEITPRQIVYYKTAARLLGLVRNNHTILTPIGHKLAMSATEREQYQIVAERFETSECGWAWLKYSEVDSVYDLDSSTAAQFLTTMSFGLSENTAVRRATTLKQWVDTFKLHR